MSKLDEVSIYGQPISKARGISALVTQDEFRGQQRLDIRDWVEGRFGDPDSLQPTRKGVNLRLDDLPQLLAALHEAEAAAIRDGHLAPAHYQDAGLPVPDELTPRAA